MISNPFALSLNLNSDSSHHRPFAKFDCDWSIPYFGVDCILTSRGMDLYYKKLNQHRYNQAWGLQNLRQKTNSDMNDSVSFNTIRLLATGDLHKQITTSSSERHKISTIITPLTRTAPIVGLSLNSLVNDRSPILGWDCEWHPEECIYITRNSTNIGNQAWEPLNLDNERNRSIQDN